MGLTGCSLAMKGKKKTTRETKKESITDRFVTPSTKKNAKPERNEKLTRPIVWISSASVRRGLLLPQPPFLTYEKRGMHSM